MTAHDDLREAVARAISEARGINWDAVLSWCAWEPGNAAPGTVGYKAHPDNRRYAIEQRDATYKEADAALAAVRAALREPSAEMISASVPHVTRSLCENCRDSDVSSLLTAAIAASPLADPGARDDGEGVG